jgi:hypothetical protein
MFHDTNEFVSTRFNPFWRFSPSMRMATIRIAVWFDQFPFPGIDAVLSLGLFG